MAKIRFEFGSGVAYNYRLFQVKWKKWVSFFQFIVLLSNLLVVYRFKVSEKKSAKIAVIGMDGVAKDITGAVAETAIYMAPEVLRGEKYDSKADIYSMGLMFWELSYGKMVSWDFPVELKREEVLRKVEKGYRPEFVDKAPDETSLSKTSLSQWIQLMKECWDEDPKSRPTAKECSERIDKVKNRFADEQSQ